MDFHRWKQLEDIVRSAKEREPDERSAFLVDVCAGDQELRREAELLLAVTSAGELPATITQDFETPPVQQPRKRLTSGTSLGRYEIAAAIGAGGMGEVYRAHDPRLGRDVAIKVLPERLARDPQAMARFEREAKAVAALSHPNIVAIFDFGSEKGISYVVTEFLKGESLGTRLRRGKIPWQEAVGIAMAIADALTAPHSKGLTHRDIKPDNVFLTAEHRVKLLDFGLARWRSKMIDPKNPGQETQTLTGMVLGTPAYMSPEQARGGTVDWHSDIFSFGCVLYEMLTGQRAFRRGSQAETLAAILTENPTPLRQLEPSVPPSLERLVSACIEKEPQDRLLDARDLSAALKAASEDATLSGGSSISTALVDSAINSIAVLPFLNATLDPELTYLTDGISENLINSLSQLQNMRVVARSTAFRYRGEDIDPEAVGRTLNVRALLTGKVTRRGERFNVQTELIDVRRGSQIWGQQFNHEQTDVFVVQEMIAGEIAKTLRLKLSDEQRIRLTRRYTENSEAYKLYLRGRFYWNKRTPDGMKKGDEYFQLAIQSDPSYALAYAGIADSLGLLATYHALSPHDAFPKARAAALKALEIDQDLSEAHTSLAYTQAFYEWDWERAEESFQRSIDLSPSYANAYHWRSGLLCALGRPDEGAASSRKAMELDPLSLPINAQLSFNLYFARKYDEGLAHTLGMLEMDPNFATAHFFTGMMQAQMQRYGEAAAGFQKAYDLTGLPINLGGLGYAYARSGQQDQARRTVAELIESGTKRYVPPATVAFIFIGLGDFDEAFKWLKAGLEDRSYWMAFVNVEPIFDPLRSDPRFIEISSHLNLPLISAGSSA